MQIENLGEGFFVARIDGRLTLEAAPVPGGYHTTLHFPGKSKNSTEVFINKRVMKTVMLYLRIGFDADWIVERAL